MGEVLSDKAEKLASVCYETACISLAEQRSDLRAIRANAAIVGAFNGLVGTLFVQMVLGLLGEELGRVDGIMLPLVLALIFFCVSVVFSFLVLLPSGGWKFEDSPKAILAVFEDDWQSDPWAEIQKKLAIAKEKRFDENDLLMRKVQQKLVFSVLAAFAQIPFWGWMLFSMGASYVEQ
jgi:hypothetical protein